LKLLNKNNLYYLTFSLLSCFAIGIAFYIVTEYLIYEEVENRLRVEKRDFEDYVAKNKGDWDNSCYFVENKISLRPVIEYADNKEVFTDTLLYDKYSGQLIPFRQLSFYSSLGYKYYHITIRKSLIESDKLLKYLTITILTLLTIAFSIMYLVQRRISRNIWRPFYNTLVKIKSFDLSKNKELVLESGNIFEFKELNQELEKMSNKMSIDYRNLKEFTENASHEIQTPLAIINAKVEELIQDRNLSEKEIYLINDIHNSSMRISKLIHALLLISKIENAQFPGTECIDFKVLFYKKLEEFEDIFKLHKLTIEYNVQGDFIFEMNPDLADILLTNLIGNSVKHNSKEGKISILLTDTGFEISNTGPALDIDPSLIFQRFKKGKQRQDSSGLGLAIVKQICLNYDLRIDYRYIDGLHVIHVAHGLKPLPHP
jgi:signal transduction histidine kinase